MEQGTLLYDERFLESWAGSIITEPATAIVELVANCWDAYASEVQITWPDVQLERQFKISDNGHGMTREEFQYIWRTIAYNRISAQGNVATPPLGTEGQPRAVFGKNGKGRFASFCFADEYLITSRKNGQEFVCRVKRTPTNPLVLEEVSFTAEGIKEHGTEIVGNGTIPRIGFSEDQAREMIGSRFLANPAFKVSVNGSQITFNDIPDLLSMDDIEVPRYGTVKIFHIDTKKADKTTKQHGIAWWVQNRAVGECKWSRSDYERVLDGRTSEAKRFTFIVQADFLNQDYAVLEDWSGFREESTAWQKTREMVQDKIREIIFDSSQADRDAKRSAVIERIGNTVNSLAPLSKDRVESFVNEVVDTCPNFGEQEIVQLSSILAKLEKTKSRYGLLEILHNQDPHDLDALHEMLSQWTIGMAKIVLDEIQTRLKLINELREKIKVAGIDEVHELQPLFEKGLWMFGAQFESIEFTSNKGMTTVIRELFGDTKGRGTRNRPDFVAMPDSSVGFYARSSYDEDYNENGSEHVVIVDLKTTRLPLGSKEKEQVWKYVKELKSKGYIRAHTRVDGFVLGDVIETGEEEPRTEGGSVKIIPILYDTILIRAEKRLLNLYSKVQDAPFLVSQQEELRKFTDPLSVKQGELLSEVI
ncbi:ATP-binding protein [Jeongeupia wiesaeckerbachi]|uniref:ATP-binding protein n=1 Tax=Jeongeupia wiesaeckerbachi TaxID=3051218 RepID=UPI003D8045D7